MSNNKKVNIFLLIIAVVLFIFLPRFLSGYWVRVITTIFMYAVIAQGMNIMSGYMGYLPFGNAMFFGIGAYVTAIGMSKGLSFLVVVPLAAITAILFSILLGLDELIFKKLYNWAGDYEVLGQEISRGDYTVCTFPWYSSVILWDGTVVPCPQDYFAKIKLGDVSQKRLSEIWNDKPYLELREKMQNSLESLTPCNKCDRLWRKKIIGLPFQYMLSFLNDNIIGYGKLRKILGSYERNE